MGKAEIIKRNVQERKAKRSIGIIMMALAIRVFIDKLNPFINNKVKTDRILRYVNKLDDESFVMAGMLIDEFKFDKQECEKFNNTEKQTDNFIKDNPRYVVFKSLVRQRVKAGRIKSKLSI
jgi:hypothetical protein